MGSWLITAAGPHTVRCTLQFSTVFAARKIYFCWVSFEEFLGWNLRAWMTRLAFVKLNKYILITTLDSNLQCEMRTNQSKLLIDNFLSRNDHNNFEVLKYLKIDRFISFVSSSLARVRLMRVSLSRGSRVMRDSSRRDHLLCNVSFWFTNTLHFSLFIVWFVQLITQLPRFLLDHRVYHISGFQNGPILIQLYDDMSNSSRDLISFDLWSIGGQTNTWRH